MPKNRMLENKPITIKPSLSIVCSRKCGFCGIKRVDFNDVRERKISKFMSLEIAEMISMEIGMWLKNGVRFELGGFGEPLLNKNTVSIVNIIRKYNPKSQIMMYTNQSVLNEDKIKELFNNGLNILFIDSYTKRDVYEAGRLIRCSKYKSEIYEKSKFNPYRKGSVERKIIVHQDYSDATSYNKRQKKLHNSAGNIDDSAYDKYNITRISHPLDKMCVRPFRELVILPDGVVPLCCLDWCRECIIGKFPEQSLQSIWDSKLFNLIRAHLYSRKRDFILCSRCNNVSSMVGLVPKPSLESDIHQLKREYSQVNNLYESFKLKRLENNPYSGKLEKWIV